MVQNKTHTTSRESHTDLRNRSYMITSISLRILNMDAILRC